MPAAGTTFAAARWLAVIIPPADVALVLSGVLSLRTGVVVALVLEALLAAVLVVEAAAFRRAYRARAARRREPACGPRSGRTGRLAAGHHPTGPRRGRGGPGAVVGGPAPLGRRTGRRAAALRRPLPAGAGRGDEVVLRFGHRRSIAVPLVGLVAVRRSVESEHARTVVRDGDRLVLSVMGDTDVELRFDPPVHVADQDEPVARVAFWVDEPQTVVRLLRDRAVPTSC